MYILCIYIYIVGICMTQMIEQGRSVLECYKGYNSLHQIQFNKALQLGHICAITDYHDSCTYTDCICKVRYIGDQCQLIHFHTDNSKFKHLGVENNNNTNIYALSEVYRMLYYT